MFMVVIEPEKMRVVLMAVLERDLSGRGSLAADPPHAFADALRGDLHLYKGSRAWISLAMTSRTPENDYIHSQRLETTPTSLCRHAHRASSATSCAISCFSRADLRITYDTMYLKTH
ncbi:hypothetical protein Q7P37_002386 [Cladosporium fusiforme]